MRIPSIGRTQLAGITLLVIGIAVSTLAVAAGDKAGRRGASWSDASARRKVGYAPDPTPIRSKAQWVLSFRYRRGKVELLRARRVRLPRAISTPRVIGRFAVELLSGPTVVERLRFDFPLLGADELAGRSRPYGTPPRFETKATVIHRVMLPDTSRASRARLVDRATGESFLIPWPPARVGEASTKVEAGNKRDVRSAEASDDGKPEASARTAADSAGLEPSPNAAKPDSRPRPSRPPHR